MKVHRVALLAGLITGLFTTILISGSTGAAPAVATLLSPNGGEVFVAGTQERISWVDHGGVVDVLLSRDDGVTWTPLGTNQADIGYAFWKVDGPSTTTARIKVRVQGTEDVSDAPFTIALQAPQTATRCSLSVDPPAASCSEEITFTATVSPAGASGVVTFESNGMPLGTVAIDPPGIAVLSVSGLIAGPHLATARYGGSATHEASVSDPVAHDVAVIATTTTLELSPPSPSFCGAPVTLTATVHGANGGAVRFFDGTLDLGQSPLNGVGVAAMTRSFAVGSHAFRAQLVSDTCHVASGDSTEHDVLGAPTTVTLAVLTPSPTDCGEPVTLEATVSPASIGRSVEFLDDGRSLGTGVVNGDGKARLTTTELWGGTRSLTAQHAGTACQAPGFSSPVTHAVVGVPIEEVTVTTTPQGCRVRLEAIIRPPTETGVVIFFRGVQGDVIGQAPIDSGRAVLVVGGSASTVRINRAIYSGSACGGNVLSGPFAINPLPPQPTTTTLTVSPFSCGGTAQLRAQVSPPVDQGVVSFVIIGDRVIGMVPQDASGVATLTTPPLTSPLVYNFVADFLGATEGTSCFGQSSSPTIRRSCTGAATTLALDAVGGGSEPPRLRAALTPPEGTGAIEFWDGDVQLGSAPIVGGEAMFDLPLLAPGRHRFLALYGGDVSFHSQVSPVLDYHALADAPGSEVGEDRLRVGPNPTLGGIRVAYRLARAAFVRLSIHDIQGREVAVLEDGMREMGGHAVAWTGRSFGGPSSPGLYFVRCRALGRTTIARFAVVR